jgi:hypothetical protein
VSQPWDESDEGTASAGSATADGRTSRRVGPKVWVIVSAALIGGLAIGVAIGAAGFSNQSLNHSANAYASSFQGVTAFQGGSVSVAPGFSAHSGCTAGPDALGASLSTIYLGVAGATACTSGDFGEFFTISTNASAELAAPHSVTFSFESTYGSGPTVSVNSITVTTSSSTAANTNQVFFVDFGTSWLPAGGISGFNVLATQTS